IEWSDTADRKPPETLSQQRRLTRRN
ncbi:hypothetical protein A2U01_0005919, partial [Trifolium medium]|nr:hypothetical protein [Trifolium medium]